MNRIKGKAVYKGAALGKIHVLQKQEFDIKKEQIEDVDAQLVRVEAAKMKAAEELQVLYEKALQEVGEDGAAIIQIQQMMLEDEDYQEGIEEMLRSEHTNAEYAVWETGVQFAEIFANMDDVYMKERAADIRDITKRIVNCLGNHNSTTDLTEPVIIVADDLSPSETVILDKSKILAFATVHGATNSHTAILARTMNIPALIGVSMDLLTLQTGMEAALDGFKEEFVLEPDEKYKEQILMQIEGEKKKRALLEEIKGKDTVTLSGRKVNLYANIGSIHDLDYVLENDAEGIGLFRSEFLYIGRNSAPDEEEQFKIYKQVAEGMAGKKVIIRTLDIGADKQADYLQMCREENPALGYRAIRICLTRKDIFKTQLRALYRAAVYGNISIMYPMIISTEEVAAIKAITSEVKQELKDEGIPYKDVEEGIMIETPAAVMISDELAGMVDFFSVGTNDLTQYTLAIDRQNEKLDPFYNPHHKAVLKMIELVTQNAHKEGKWVGICGELGADTELTETFVKMGIDELSVAPGAVLKIRQIIRQIQ